MTTKSFKGQALENCVQKFQVFIDICHKSLTRNKGSVKKNTTIFLGTEYPNQNLHFLMGADTQVFHVFVRTLRFLPTASPPGLRLLRSHSQTRKTHLTSVLPPGFVSEAWCPFQRHASPQSSTLNCMLLYWTFIFFIEPNHSSWENVSPFILLMNQASHIFQ